jgi:hypothetical protein
VLYAAVVLSLTLSAIARADFVQRIASNASCAGCHADIASEWMQSLHKQAWKDPVFQKAYAIEPLPFCRGCHAPESDPQNEPTVAAQHLGIGCVSCHVDPAGIHASTKTGRAQHEVTVDPSFATRAVCARCHEFDFPADARLPHPVPMQDTAREHEHSDAAATPCQSCHMPIVDGPDGKHRSHRFSVISDPELLRQAVQVKVSRRDVVAGVEVALELTAGKVGHAFPTGDMFRRLEVRAFAIDEKGAIVTSSNPVALERRFEDRPRDPYGSDLSTVRVEVEDSRVPAPGQGSRTVVLRLPAIARGHRVGYRVAYQRMSTPMAHAFGVSQVLDEVVVADGVLAVPPKLASLHGGSR